MSALPKPLAIEPSAPQDIALAARLRAEWRVARWPARASIIVLLLFYLFASASPVIAPYDPAYQYRDLPDCPPMALHLSRGADRNHSLFFAYPAKMLDPLARRFTDDRS